MYHESRNVLYSANGFKISDPKVVGPFVKRLQHVNNRSLAIRSVLLHVKVTQKNEERAWDNAFRELAESVTKIRHIKVEIDEHIWNDAYCCNPRNRHSPAYGKSPFLQGLLAFKTLPLKTVELVMIKRQVRGMCREIGIWTDVQKQRWMESIRKAVLASA